MIIQTLKVISNLFLLLGYLGLCSADRHGPILPHVDKYGIKIEGANCGMNYYTKVDINAAVRTGFLRVQGLKRKTPPLDRLAFYNPGPYENLHLVGPYYQQLIYATPQIKTSRFETDYVVFTKQGQLVNVIYQMVSIDGSVQLEDCKLVHAAPGKNH